MVTSNHFLKSKVKNSQPWQNLGRTSRGFCDVDLQFIVVILHLSMFFIHIFILTSSLNLLWIIIARFLDPFCTFSPAHGRVIHGTFVFRAFHYLLTASATILSGHCFTHWHFLPYAPFQHFWHIPHFGTICFYYGFTNSLQLLS